MTSKQVAAREHWRAVIAAQEASGLGVAEFCRRDAVPRTQLFSWRRRLREECLRASWFLNLFDARRKIADWREDYNQRRPHSSLGYLTPAEFARGRNGEGLAGQGASNADPLPRTPIPAQDSREGEGGRRTLG